MMDGGGGRREESEVCRGRGVRCVGGESEY